MIFDAAVHKDADMACGLRTGRFTARLLKNYSTNKPLRKIPVPSDLVGEPFR